MTTDEWEKKIVETLAIANAMKAAPKQKNLGIHGQRFDRELKRLMGIAPDPPARPVQTITAEEVEVARAAELERRERAESLRLMMEHAAKVDAEEGLC